MRAFSLALVLLGCGNSPHHVAELEDAGAELVDAADLEDAGAELVDAAEPLGRPLSSFELMAASTAAAVWEERGFPVVAGCLDGLRVESARDAEHYRELCASDSNVTAGCLHGDVVVYAPGIGVDGWGEPLVHESLHALVRCAGLAPNADATHSLYGVWLDETRTSVQWLAEQRVDEQRRAL